MKRADALAIIARYQAESPEVILSALEIEWGAEIPWEADNLAAPAPWRPKEFRSPEHYRSEMALQEMMASLQRMYEPLVTMATKPIGLKEALIGSVDTIEVVRGDGK